MRFECVKCGGCCKQNGALRLLYKEDIIEISKFLNLTVEEFCKQYNVQHIYKNLCFIEIHNECYFLDKNNNCTINPVKPFFCANYIPYIDNPGSPIYEVCRGLGLGRDWKQEEIEERYNKMIEKLVIVKDGDC